jgi:DNA mismatch repair protein MutS
MNETAYILNTATDMSLVIMDEVGRGTGTKDGLSIAWAVCEELLNQVRCRTLFATHYHELSLLSHPRMANRSMEVLNRDGEIVFLRRIKEGPAAESYGLHVARLAGLSREVLDRAGRIMEQLEERDRGLSLEPSPKPASAGENALPAKLRRLFEEINALDPDNITPMAALQKLQRWKNLLINTENNFKSAKNKKSPAAFESPGLFDSY